MINLSGITVLSKEAVSHLGEVGFIASCVAMGTFLAIFLLLAYLSFLSKDRSWLSYFVIALIFLALLCSVIRQYRSPNNNYMEYKVLIDDTVPLKEFNEKYEILYVEGQIYTIKEKT